MHKLSKFIVEKRVFFITIFIVACIYSLYAMQKVQINYDLTKYLPEESETKIALDMMEEEFGLNGIANVVIADVSANEAIILRNELGNIEGVLNASFENTLEYYKEGNAMIKIVLAESDYSNLSQNAVQEIKDKLSDYTIEMSGSTVHTVAMQENVKNQMTTILLISIPIIALILFLNASSYAEIGVFSIVVGASVLINKGTNLLLGEISYITNSIAIVLQLALAMDYSIIFLHRFEEEKKKYPEKEAVIHALKQSMRSISSSSLTTIVGMIAIMFMQYTIGYDIGIVLAKSIVCSLLSVFFFMPGILLLFNKLIVKTRHKNLMPNIKFIPNYIIKTKGFMPFIMLVVISVAFILQFNNTYEFNFDAKKDSQYIELFGKTNTLEIMLPKGEVETEKEVVRFVMENPYVNNASGIEPLGLRDQLDVEAFSEKAGIDLKSAYGIYAYYAKSLGIDTEVIQFDTMINFIHHQADELGLSSEQVMQINAIKNLIEKANQEISSDLFSDLFEIPKDNTDMIYMIYDASQGFSTYTTYTLISFLTVNGESLGLSEEEQATILQLKSLLDLSHQNIEYHTLGNLIEITQEEAYFINCIYDIQNITYGIADIVQYMNHHQVELGLDQTQIEKVTNALNIINNKDIPMTASQYAQFLDITETDATRLYNLYNQLNGTNEDVIVAHSMISFMQNHLFLLSLTDEERDSLNTVHLLMNNNAVSPNDFSNVFNIELINGYGIYTYYAESLGFTPSSFILNNMIQFINHNAEDLQFDHSQKTKISQINDLFDYKDNQTDADTFARLLNISHHLAYGIYAYYGDYLDIETNSINLNDLLLFMKDNDALLALSETEILDITQALNFINHKNDRLDTETFSSLLGMNGNETTVLYYAYQDNDFVFKDIINYMYDKKETLELNEAQKEKIIHTKELMSTAFNNFESDEYARIFFNINLNIDDEKALNLVKSLRTDLNQFYDEYYVLGDSSNILDIKASFNHDVFNVNFITIISILFILIITFRSFIVPILLVLIIQGSIWINFSFANITNTSIVFIGYIIVTAIQMGATIDYAIVLTERYREFRKENNKFNAVKETIQVSIPIILTSAGILIVSGFTVGSISSISSISSLGILIGRGALISFIMVIFLLPQLLLIFDKIVCKRNNY